MNTEKLYLAAERAGFAAAAEIETSELLFRHEFRIFCEENDCGNYGKNYACPPYCGTPQEMEDKAKSYRRALVFQSRTEVDNLYDTEVTKFLKKEHTRMTVEAVAELKKQGLDENGIFIMCGPCSRCAQCGMPRGIPCPHEEGKYSCLSAYCIDSASLAERCGMEIEWIGNTVSFFSMYLYGKK